MKKRILSLVLCFCMILSQLPVSAFAEEIITTPAVTLSIESSTLTLGGDTANVTAALIDGAFTQTGDAAVEISIEGDAAELTDGILTPVETGEVTVTASLTGTPYSEDNPEGYILADGYNGDAVSQKITIEELQREECTVSSDDSNDILQDDSEAELSLDAVTNDANTANAAEICAIGGTTYSSITKALSAANTGTIKLLADVTETADIKITSGKTITLDLNDHILNLYGHRIINKGILTLCDSAAETSRYFTDADGDGCYEGLSDTSSTGAIEVTGGVITGGNASAENAIHGGAVCNNSTFYMNGGNIVGNKIASGNANSALGGGVYNKGTFVMNGGMIAGNLVYGQTNTGADNSGGGVFNATGATFTLSNGTISCNKATGEGANDKGSCYGFGGGVCAFGTFNMKGGTLADNKAQENGGGVAAYSTLTLTGGTVSGNTARWGAGIDNTKATVTITGGTFTNNTAYGGGVVDNEGTLSVTGGTFENNKAVVGGGIYAFKNFTLGGSVQFTANKTKTGKVSNVYLSKSALITPDDYSGTCAVAKSGKTGVISTATDSKYLSSFTSENTSYGIHFNSDRALEISPFAVTVNKVAGGSITCDPETAKKGDKVTLTITPDTGYQCTGCTVTRSDGGAVTVNNNTFTMPDSDVNVTGTFTQKVYYNVTVHASTGGTVNADVQKAEAGDTVTLTIEPENDYRAGSLSVTRSDNGQAVAVNNNAFVMPDADVAVSCKFDKKYNITKGEMSNGTVTVDSNAYEGDTVTLSSTPASGYVLQEYIVYKTDDSATKVTVTGSSFVMPAYNVTVTAVFTNDNTDYLKFTSDAAFSITPDGSWKGTLQYSTDKKTWDSYSLDSTESEPVPAAKAADGKYTLYFRGTDNNVITGYDEESEDSYVWALTPTGENKENQKIAASGNIMTLLNYTNPDNAQMDSYAFANMFEGCPCLISTPELPATTLAVSCYSYMFSGCTSLASAPELPATALAESCYESMFDGCTSLASAPELPAKTLAKFCYDDMFSGCTSLTSAPELPATALAESCYESMFDGCTSLASAPELPAETLAEFCYGYMFSGCTSLTSAPELPAETLVKDCYNRMFSGCTSLASAPKLPAEKLADFCYYYMFYGCTSLTSAPKLPATTLADYCYFYMFSGCTSLTSAPELPATTLADCCYDGMFSGCIALTRVPKISATDFSAEYCCYEMFKECKGLKLYNSGYGAYFSIPENADLSTYSVTNMFSNIGSSGTDASCPATPVKGVEYYYSQTPDTTDYLKFTSDAAFSITPNGSWEKTLEYSTDKYNWASVEKGNAVSAALADGKYTLYFRGTGNTVITYGSTWELKLEKGNKIAASGNIMTLLNYQDPDNAPLGKNAFYYMFFGWSNLASAPALPATTLAEGCYSSMFYGCSSLASAPALPATTLAEDCYSYMFDGCSSLASAPALPATTLAEGCYDGMFYGCSNLASAPALPATTLAENCYCGMFYGCTKLKVTTERPEAAGCYQIWHFPAEEKYNSSFTYMLTGTANALTVTSGTTYYLMTYDGQGLEGHHRYNTADNVSLSDNINKAIVGYTGSKLIVEPNTPSSYTLEKITVLTDSTAETDTPERDITAAKEIACNYGESAAVTVTSKLNVTVDKEIVTDEGITASESYLQAYVNTQKASATGNTTYTFTVKAQDPDATKKTAIETLAAGKMLTFYDASLTKTVEGSAAETITNTYTNILSFTIPYDMTGKKDLAVYRYCEGDEDAAKLDTELNMPVNMTDGSYYVSGTGADTQVTIFASSFSTYAIGAAHDHIWNYELSEEGNTITAKCCNDAGTCDYTGTDNSLTIQAPTEEDLKYDGNAKPAAFKFSAETETFLGSTELPSITYYKKGTLGIYNPTPESGAPVNAGTYKACFTCGEKTASVEYTISKAAPDADDFTFTPPANCAWNDEAKEATVTAKDGISGMGEVTVKYYADAACETEKEPKDTGTYYVGISVAEGDNYEAATLLKADAWQFEISKIAASVTVKDGETETTTYYEKLADAWAAAQENGTAIVTLLANAEANLTNASGKEITLDLNGYVLNGTGSSSVSVVTNRGTLTIQDSNTDNQTHYYTVGSNGLWTWDDSKAENAEMYETLTARPKTGTVIAVQGGCITGGNKTGGGGGIYSSGGTVNLQSGNIIGNTTAKNGGGLCFDNGATFNMRGGTVAGNYGTGTETSSLTYGGGGILFDSSTINMSAGEVSFNTTPLNGGGIYSYRSALNVTGNVTGNVTFKGNYAGQNGGGIYQIYYSYKGSAAYTGAAFTNNTAGESGGGLWNNTTATAEGCTFTDNTAASGSAVFEMYRVLTLYNCSITGNTTTSSASGAVTLSNVTSSTAAPSFALTGNTQIINNNGVNLYLLSGKTVTVTNPGDNMSVGVTLGSDDGTGAVTNATSADYSSFFKSDNTNYGVVNSGTGDSQVVQIGSSKAFIVETGKSYDTVQLAVDAATDQQTVKMAANSTENVTVASDDNLTLDLNGYVLSAPSTGGSVITNNGTLSITDSRANQTHYFTVNSTGLWAWDDSSTTGAVAYEALTARPATNAVIAVKGGCITGGNKTGSGGGIYSSGNMTFNSGNVIGNTITKYGGGIAIDSGKTLTVNGGIVAGNLTTGTEGGTGNGGGVAVAAATSANIKVNAGDISFNRANRYGGGLYANAGSILVNGGTITYNYAKTNAGGGICSDAPLTIEGGTIQHNIAKENGGAVFYSNTLTVGGSPIITENSISGNTVCNVYPKPQSGQTITVDASLTGDAEIGVTLANGTGSVTGTNSADYSMYFASDNTNYAVMNTGLSGTVSQIVALVDGYAITCADCENGSLSVGIQKSAYAGKTVTVTATPDSGYALGVLYYTAEGKTDKVFIIGGEFEMPAGNVTVYATFTQKASTVCYIDADSNGKFDEGEVEYTSISEALAVEKPAAETEAQPTVIRMIENSYENIFEVENDRYVTLDLNGYVLIKDEDVKPNLITNNGHLTVTDSNREAIHYYTVVYNGSLTGDSLIAIWDDANTDNAISIDDITEFPAYSTVVSVKGGAITSSHAHGGVENHGSFTLDGGNLIGNWATDTVGGGVNNTGTFNMNGGMICLNWGNTFGGGVANCGTFNMNGGVVKCNMAGYLGGGIANGVLDEEVTGHAVFTMTDGAITGNIAAFGGGVANFGNYSSGQQTTSVFTMTGGAISNNAATQGGGVSNANLKYFFDYFNVDAVPVFTMLGGSITNNKASDPFGLADTGSYTPQYSGVCNAGTMTVGKTAVISGNTYNDKTENLCIDSGTIDIAADDNQPAEGMSIGVTLASGAGQFTSNGDSTDTDYFTSDNTSYIVKYNGENYLELLPIEVADAAYYASLTLNKNIDINFKMKNLGAAFDVTKLGITVNGTAIGSDKITYSSTDQMVSCVLQATLPQDIGTPVNVVVTYNNVQVKKFTYSVKDYCDAVFAAYETYEGTDTTQGKLYSLCEAVLNYGKYAEDYKNGITSSTLNEEHAIDFTNYTVKCEDTDTTYAGYADSAYASLSLGSTITLNYVLTNCKVDLTDKNNFGIYYDTDKTLNSERVSVTKNDTETTVSIELYASELSTSYSMKLKDVDKEDFCITYGVYNYCYEVQSIDSTQYPAFTVTLKTLCKAIHNYGEAVQNYIKQEI